VEFYGNYSYISEGNVVDDGAYMMLDQEGTVV
jgi:hypothetical protein